MFHHQTTSTVPVINRNIHFVWAGGKMMSADKQAVVRKWADLNPAYTVYIWVDSKTTTKAELDEFLEQLRAQSQHKNIELRDIVDAHLDDEYVRYEIDGTRKNYGGSSDKLRYTILYNEGVLYIDADVYPVEPLPENIPAPHGALFAPHTQGIDTIGNDTLLAVKGSEIFRDLAKLSRSSYDLSWQGWQDRTDVTASSVEGYPVTYNILYELETPNVKSAITLDRTGPALVRTYLCSKGIITPNMTLSKNGEVPANVAAKVILHKNYTVDPSYLISGQYFEAHEQQQGGMNTLGWMRTGIVDASYQAKLQMTLSSIKFEVEHMGILRLNEHIAALVHKNKFGEQITVDQALKDLCGELMSSFQRGTIDASKIQGFQLVPYMASGIGAQLYEKFLKTNTSQSFAMHTGLLAKIILQKNEGKEFPSLNDQELLSLLHKLVATCGGSEKIFSRMNDVHAFRQLMLQIGCHIQTYPQSVNFMLQTYPYQDGLADLFKQHNKILSGKPLSVAQRKEESVEYLSRLIRNVNKLEPLIYLLYDMLVNDQKQYNLLRTEIGRLRATEFGNTKTWDKVVTAIKDKLIEVLKQSKQKYSKETLDQVAALLAIPSARTMSSLFSAIPSLDEFEKMRHSLEQRSDAMKLEKK